MGSGIPADNVAYALASHRYWVGRQAFDAPLIDRLYVELLDNDRRGGMTPAGVGRGTSRTVDADVRGDRIRWIGPDTDNERQLFTELDVLRRSLGRALLLGLADYEAHFAIYPPGARYERHVDRFRYDSRRVLSFVLYLTPHWCAADGGELVLYREEGEVRVLPAAGTLVLFGAEVPHEVLPARRPRASVAGWFRQRLSE